jgi:hypothetical protein
VLAQHLPEADQAFVGRRHVVVVVEEADAPMAGLDQVGDGRDRAAHLIRDHGRDDAARSVESISNGRHALQVRAARDTWRWYIVA